MWKVWVFGGAASSWDSWASTSTFDADENSLVRTSKDLEGPIDSHQFTHAQNFPGWGRTDELWLIREGNRFSDPFRFGRDREPVSTGPWRKEKKAKLLHEKAELVVFRIKAMLMTLGTALAGKKEWQQISGYHIKRPAYLLRWYMSPTGNWRKSSECRKRTAILQLYHRLLPVTCLFRPFMPSELLSKSEADSSELLFCWVELQSGNQPAPTKQDLSGHFSERTF